MITAGISALIDKEDNFEKLRDQIAAILTIEFANQVAIATAQNEDASLWDMRVFKERANPWELYLIDEDGDLPDQRPIVNVSFDSMRFNKSKSNAFERSMAEAVYTVDCYGAGVSRSQGTGHVPGDREAALACQRAVRLVRNILMSAHYQFLGLQGTVWGRWINTITVDHNKDNEVNVEQIVGGRIQLLVEFNEFAPQVPLETLEELSIHVIEAANGEVVLDPDGNEKVLVEAEYKYTQS